MQAALRGTRWPTRDHGALRRGQDARAPRGEQAAVAPLAERPAVTAQADLWGRGARSVNHKGVRRAPAPPVWRPPAGVISAVCEESGPWEDGRGTRTRRSPCPHPTGTPDPKTPFSRAVAVWSCAAAVSNSRDF